MLRTEDDPVTPALARALWQVPVLPAVGCTPRVAPLDTPIACVALRRRIIGEPRLARGPNCRICRALHSVC